MTIEIFAWCSSRDLFVQGMTTTALPDGTMLATLDDNGNLIPHSGVIIDEIGPVTKVPAVLDKDGNELTPAVIIDGHHVNLVAWGEMAQMLTMGPPDAEGNPTQLPQYNQFGELLSVFERTNILQILPGHFDWEQITIQGVPAGWKGPNGVRMFDPAVVNSRARVWL